MWYLRKVESSCEHLDPDFTRLRTKYIKFWFQNLINGKEDKKRRIDHDLLLRI